LNGYITAGVASDHECSTVADALEKLKRGQWIMIREGTAAKNMDALMPLFQEPYCNRCMLVTDDKHPGDLIQLGHIDYMIRKAIRNGADPIKAIKMATKQPAEYFGLKNVGAIAPGYKANLVVLEDMQNVRVTKVYKDGKLVAQNGRLLDQGISQPTNNKQDKNYKKVYHSFHMNELTPKDFLIHVTGKFMRVIELIPGELLTREIILPCTRIGVDIQEDIIKLAVVERHHNTGHIGIGYLKGYGMRNGAVASSISHDSHNLIVAGTNDEDMSLAGNCVRKNEGGIAVVTEGKILGELALPIAGLMCQEKAEYVQKILIDMKAEARRLGVPEKIDPFMTLAFISLPVIPEIRLTTLGLVDVASQELIKTIY
jgi:adenine deaminase